MMVDKEYCMSSFLMHRTIIDRTKSFSEKLQPRLFVKDYECDLIHNADELGESLRKQIEEASKKKKLALFLSGGVDSAILAKYMPKGTTAYTFKCVVPGKQVHDETPFAAKYAQACGLQHKVVEIFWEDFEKFSDPLMFHKGSPMHSIEVQLYKAAMVAKADGFDCVVIGESADINYGGLDGLLSRDWGFEEYIERFSYAKPEKILKHPQKDLLPFLDCCDENGLIDVFKHLREWDMYESLGSYDNACTAAGVEYLMPYSHTWLNIPLDLKRIRSGDTKYLVRELFRKEYAGLLDNAEVISGGRKKLPMPRPMNEWFENWQGPVRPEFLPNCIDELTGDQRWLVYSLERFLNLMERLD